MIQSLRETLIHWLYTNAPVAWLSALVAFALLLNNLRLRKRPTHLVIREMYRTSFVQIRPSAKNEIVTTFQGMPHVNSFREHKQIHNIDIIAGGGTTPTKVAGSGEGWSVRYLRARSEKTISADVSVRATAQFLLFAGAVIACPYLLHALGYRPATPTSIKIISMLPMVGLLAFYIWSLIRSALLLRRLNKEP